jgi:hypothetical protein
MKRVRTTTAALILRSLPYQRKDTDTGKRFRAGQTALALGETFDRKWRFLDAPEGNGWASTAYLTDAPIVIPSPTGAYPPIPKTREAIGSIFGAAGSPAASAGRVTLPAPLKLGWAQQTSVTRVACHVKMVAPFTDVFNRIHADGLWPNLRTFDGIYNDRSIKGSAKKSLHAYGIAIDLNASTNQMGRTGDMPPAIVKIFEDIGFCWGGRFKRKDAMHFEWSEKGL